jgi:hypothetical protein
MAVNGERFRTRGPGTADAFGAAMLRRDPSITPALILFAAILASACQPGTGDTAATETAATESAATETTGSEPTTTTDADPTDATESGATTGDDACVAPDPAASAAVGIDFGQWPMDSDSLTLAAECAVESATNQGGAIEIGLRCSEGEQVDVAIGLSLTAPADFAFQLDVGAQVQLQAYWRADGHHIGTGEWFVLHDAAGDELLLAGLDLDSATAANEALGALAIAAVAGVCEPSCGEECFDTMDGTERLALAFTHDDGPSLTLLDQGRGSLGAGGRSFDVVLDAAMANYCLNCWSDYVWIIGGVAG